MKRSILISSLLLLTFVSAQAQQNRDWKTGKLLDTDKQHYTVQGGSSTQGQISPDGTYSSSTSTARMGRNRFSFVVQGDDYVYVVSHVIKWRWSSEVQLTVNGPVKYAVEKKDFYLLDETGKEYKMKIDKKILREKPTSP